MPRRRRRPPRGARPEQDAPLRGGYVRVEAGGTGDAADDWVVRSISGSAATKDYRCPGCDQVIVAGTPHVVAWPAEDGLGSDERRHWHTGCWRRGR